MAKTNSWQKLWLRGGLILHKQFVGLKRKVRGLAKSAKPFLVPKFWLIYLAAFGVGFYLWGPFHGWQKVVAWQPFKHQQAKVPTVETLQKEITQIKQEIKIKPPVAAPTSSFSPAAFGPPAEGRIINGFEWRPTNGFWQLHSGVDVSVPFNSCVLAAAEGIVTEIKVQDNGYAVLLDHGNGWESLYSNLITATVHLGDKVIKGATLGRSGNKVCDSDAAGFHFAVYQNKQAVDPINVVAGLTE